MQAYALSETASSLAIAYPNQDDLESVGTIFEDLDVKIFEPDKDGVGEIIVKESEPAEIHFLVGCPPVVAPCFYGVAMATKKELIAANYSIEEIKEQLDIDTLGYITLDALIDAIGMPAEDLCLGCLNEEYPTELPDDIEAETYYKP